MIDMARECLTRGRAVPDRLRDHVAALLNPPVADIGNDKGPGENLEVGNGVMSVTEAADRTGLAKRTVRHLAETGQIQAHQPAPRAAWVINLDSLRDHIRRS